MKVKFVTQNEAGETSSEVTTEEMKTSEFEISSDESVMQLAHKNGVFIKSVCNGLPSCAECRVRIVEGEHNVLPPSNKELSLIGTGYFIDRRRLSCQLKCFGDVVIDLSEQEKKAKDSQGPKRPQGHIRKSENEESRAITGNLIEQDDEMKSVPESPKEGGRERKNSGRSGDKKPRFKGKRSGSKPSGNSANKSEGTQRKKKSGGSQKNGAQKNNRQRNRSRNKKTSE